MRTLKDILEVPLKDLNKGIKLWVDHSCKFWEEWLNDHNISTAVEAGEKTEEATETELEKPKLPDDIAIVVEYNKAIVEKYQSSGAESLLKHLAAQLAKERNLKLDDKTDTDGETVGEALLEELKAAVEVSPEKRELLKLNKTDRVESIIIKVIDDNPEFITKIMNGDKEVIKELDKKAIDVACGTISESDLKFALRSMIQSELMKEIKTNA